MSVLVLMMEITPAMKGGTEGVRSCIQFTAFTRKRRFVAEEEVDRYR